MYKAIQRTFSFLLTPPFVEDFKNMNLSIDVKTEEFYSD